MIFEVEVYVVIGNGACDTIVVDVEGDGEKDARDRMIASLNGKGGFVGIGSGVFQKENVRGTCIIRRKKGGKHGI
jgi:hypothetical protein